MSLNWRPAPSIPCSVGTSDPFINSLYEFLKYLEANNPITRRNLHVVGSNLTIGIGFDLRAGGPAVIRAVFGQLGLDYDYPEKNANAQPGSPEAIESDYIRRLRVAVQGSNKTAVNNLMLQRYNNSLLNSLIPQSQRRRSFSFNNDNEVKAVFDNLWPNVYREYIYNRLPSLRNDAAFATSSEMMALASLVWNGGPGKLTKELRADIDSGNRAEAWFEIRYNSNKGYIQFRPGIAKRRYFESQMFGLYDNPASVTPTEAQQIYKMLQTHRPEIVNYEQNYGVPVDGTNPLQGNRIAAAKNDFKGLLSYVQSGTVQTVEESLNLAKAALFTYLQGRSDLPDLLKTKLSENNVASTNIYLNPHKPTDTNQISILNSLLYETGLYANGANDLMIGMDQLDIMFGWKGNDILIGEGGGDLLDGGEGDDVLHGGGGNDILYGGKGNDTMYGGADNDTYYIEPGDGNDTIEDKQGKNKVMFCGEEINFFYQDGDGYVSISGDLTASIVDGHFDVTDGNGTTVRLNENFQWGDFGTTLIDLPDDISAPPEISNTIVGDLTPVDFDPEMEGIQTQNDQWGNVITDPAQPDPGRNDVLYDTTASDKIEGLGGNDSITVSRGSSTGDWVLGGYGNDYITINASGNILVEGGSGNDDIYTSAAELNARIYGDDGDDVITTDSNGSGWLYGGEGSDIIDGERLNNCIIEGGPDSDIIIGGINGNNQLFGDSRGGDGDLATIMATHIAEGETAPDSGVRGDIVAADGENNNFLFGLLRLPDPHFSYFSLFHDAEATVVI